MQKHKFAYISLTVQDRAISSKFSTHRVSQQSTLANFQKIFLSLKMTAILNFRFSPKMKKHKFPSISLTVRDRGISSKFSTPRVSRMYCRLFTKITFPPLLVAILNFCVKRKSTFILETVQKRVISMKFLTRRVYA